MKLKWKRGTFTTAVRDLDTGGVTTLKRDGWVCGLFGIDRRKMGSGLRWVPTHIPTGMKPGQSVFRLKADAQGFVEMLLGLPGGSKVWDTAEFGSFQHIPGLKQAVLKYNRTTAP